MSKQVRIYGDISTDHEAEFMIIKGVHGCKSNGEAFEKMIDLVAPDARKLAAKKARA